MRYSLISLLGLLALGGVESRAFPSGENSHLQILDRAPPDPEYSAGSVKRASPPRPAPPRPKPPVRPRPNNGEDAVSFESSGMSLERSNPFDPADGVSPCGGAARKRSLNPFEAAYHVSISKRSPDDGAKTWKEWQIIYTLIDTYLQAHTLPKVRLIVIGGISAIAGGARDEGGIEGRTGDTDYIFPPGTSSETKEAVKEAIRMAVRMNQNAFPQPHTYPNSKEARAVNSRYGEIAKAELVARLAQNSHKVAWSGESLEFVHADEKVQLMEKLDRIARAVMHSPDSKAPPKDIQDAKYWLSEVRKATGTVNKELGIADFVAWGVETEIDRDDAITRAREALPALLGRELTGINAELQQLIRDKAKAFKTGGPCA
ncbi:hypothetical protein M011DRAFT_475948 [Sporormia fimetaria CBS 119925]|uniref:Uncharacterized protein n=1 Tax=Sporormia fimetaria CBS 119925 TaxID=1340428 RepID=A0A6A6VJC1_9PLEO|nr:hypothetical protein M011DRAFT_475948 [Sporormia fimetaria CBS 119925]